MRRATLLAKFLVLTLLSLSIRSESGHLSIVTDYLTAQINLEEEKCCRLLKRGIVNSECCRVNFSKKCCSKTVVKNRRGVLLKPARGTSSGELKGYKVNVIRASSYVSSRGMKSISKAGAGIVRRGVKGKNLKSTGWSLILCFKLY